MRMSDADADIKKLANDLRMRTHMSAASLVGTIPLNYHGRISIY